MVLNLDFIYPIGSIYLSTNNISPQTIFGGTWEQLTGGYLYAGSSYSKTSYTGTGTQGHTLTQQELAKHSHTYSAFNQWGPNHNVTHINMDAVAGTTASNQIYYSTLWASETGGDQPHSHNIATIQVYAWCRTK